MNNLCKHILTVPPKAGLVHPYRQLRWSPRMHAIEDPLPPLPPTIHTRWHAGGTKRRGNCQVRSTPSLPSLYRDSSRDYCTRSAFPSVTCPSHFGCTYRYRYIQNKGPGGLQLQKGTLLDLCSRAESVKNASTILLLWMHLWMHPKQGSPAGGKVLFLAFAHHLDPVRAAPAPHLGAVVHIPGKVHKPCCSFMSSNRKIITRKKGALL